MIIRVYIRVINLVRRVTSQSEITLIRALSVPVHISVSMSVSVTMSISVSLCISVLVSMSAGDNSCVNTCNKSSPQSHIPQ